MFNTNLNFLSKTLSVSVASLAILSSVNVLAQNGIQEVFGTSGNDQLVATNSNERIYGFQGNDSYWGMAGQDVIYGGKGNDSLYGNTEDDFLSGDFGNDNIWGGQQNDILLGRGDNDNLMGDRDNDFLSGGAGNDNVWGGPGNDVLIGSDDSQDYLLGEDGEDRIYTAGGASIVYGGNGNDEFFINPSSTNTGYPLTYVGGESGTDTYYIQSQTFGSAPAVFLHNTGSETDQIYIDLEYTITRNGQITLASQTWKFMVLNINGTEVVVWMLGNFAEVRKTELTQINYNNYNANLYPNIYPNQNFLTATETQFLSQELAQNIAVKDASTNGVLIPFFPTYETY